MLSLRKMMMMWIAVVLLLLTAAGCTTILDTDFDSSSGSWASGELPGLPLGDSAEVQGQVLGLGTIVSLGSSTSARLDLITGGKPHNTSGYSINFNGIKLTITETPIIAIDALDAQEQIACGLEISGGEFRLISGDGERVIGNYSGSADVHRVFMRLNLGVGTCGLRIEQVAQGFERDAPQTIPLIIADGPLVTEEFQELDRLRIAWEDTQGVPNTQYFIDSVTIRKDNS